jgi:hypothetical protein
MNIPILYFICCLLVLLTSLSGVSVARSQSIEVRPVSPELFEIEPGGVVSLAFRVANRGETEEEFIEELSLPAGWRLVMPMFEFILGPGREATRLALVQAGRDLPAGDYQIAYTVTSRRDYALADTAVVRAALRPVYNLSLLLEGQAPGQVIAGEPFKLRVRLINEGNVDLAVTMDARISGEGRVNVAPASFTLERGKTRLLEVTAHADPAEHRLSRQHVRLEALTGLRAHGRHIAARLSVPIEVVPLVAGQDMYHRYPLEFTGYLASNDDDFGLQIGLKGAGYLDENRQRRLDFLLRIPDGHERGVFARRDEYRVSYGEPGYSVKAGDQAYVLSQLTSWHRYGRGLGIDLHQPGSAMGAGIHHVQDRWSMQQRKDTGGYLAYSPAPWAALRLNLLTLGLESWREKPAARDNLASLQGDFKLREQDQLEAEIGYSSGERKEAGSDAAWRLAYTGQAFEEVRYAFSSRWAGPDWAGRYPDSALHSGTVSFPLARALRGNIAYSRYERNLDLDPARGSAFRENLYNSGVTVTLPQRWRASLNYEFYDRRDALPEIDRAFQEHGARLGLGRSTGFFSYQAEVRRGWADDKSISERSDGWNYNLNLTYQPSRALALSFHGGFGDDEAPGESRLLRRGRNLGGNARWQATRDFSAHLRYTRYDLEYPDQPLRERAESDHFGAGFGYRLPNEHRLQFDIRHSDGNLRDSQTSYFATYSIPYAVPLARKSAVGALEGRVYRADQPGAPGVAGAVVYVAGTAARTDSTGRFVFRTLPPGDYEIRLDERSIGLESVPADLATRKVSVSGGRTAASDIAITRSSRLAGRITLVSVSEGKNGNGGGNGVNGNGYVSGNGNGKGNGSTLGNLLLELSRPGETRRTVSDQHGEFLFERLHPGEWTLKVHDHNLPQNHYLEASTISVIVDAGKEKEVSIRVHPRLREIRFVDEGLISAMPPEKKRF